MGRLKEITTTSNYSWSPLLSNNTYIACGTAAQQLDCSFSSNSKVEIFKIDFSDPNLASPCVGNIETADRFHKVAWGWPDIGENGMIVTGTDKGGIQVYDPAKIINGDSVADCLLWSTAKHTGPVRALDFNTHQGNLIASGANDGEIFIWDLKNPSSPMTPGTKTQPSSAVNSLAWNKQVQHILASTSSLSSGPSCTVWDLKKNEPVIKVHDPSGRMQCSDVAWHPQVATQLALSSDTDHCPVVQIWDLRFAASPVKVFEQHSKGILSLAWSTHDPDLLLSCSKTNEVFCWNPNSAPIETVYELQTSSHHSFDVQWCPNDANIISSGSFDGVISIYSVMNGGFHAEEAANHKQRDALAESFGADFAATTATPQQQQAQQAAAKKVVGTPLLKAPKWMKRPCGVSFAFGGRLVSFGEEKAASGGQQPATSRQVHISQVVTEEALLTRSKELRAALIDNNSCQSYCTKKVEAASAQELEIDIWNFLLVNFESDPRRKYLELLGYNAADLKAKFECHLTKSVAEPPQEVVQQPPAPIVNEPAATVEPCDEVVAEEQTAAATTTEEEQVEQPAVGQTEELFPQAQTEELFPQAQTEELFPQGEEFLPQQVPQIEIIESKVEDITLDDQPQQEMVIPLVEGDLDSLISQALLIGDYQVAVDLCINGDRLTDAVVIAKAGGEELYEKTQQYYFQKSTSKISRLLSAVVTKNWSDVVQSCDLSNWKEAFAALLTYANDTELRQLCDDLGERLEKDATNKKHAILCYLCSGNIQRLVKVWNDLVNDGVVKSDDADQDFVEILMVLLHVLGDETSKQFGDITADKLARYATLLADQGEFDIAMEILPTVCTEESIKILRERLHQAVTAAKQIQQQQQQQPAQQQQQYQQQNNYQTNTYNQYQQQQPAYHQPVPAATQQPATPVSSVSNPYAAKRLPHRAHYASATQAVAAAPVANMFVPTPQPVAAPQQPMMHPQQPTTIAPQQPMMQTSQPQPMMMQPSMQPKQHVPTSIVNPMQVNDMMAPTSTYNGGQPSQPLPPQQPQAPQRRSATIGWNDPPPLDPNRTVKKKKPAVSQPSFTGHFMTPTAPVQQQGLGQYHPGSHHQPAAFHGGPPSGSMMQPPQNGMPQPPINPVGAKGDQSAFMQKIANGGIGNDEFLEESDNQQQQQQANEQPSASVTTGALRGAPKAPIPSEHEILQTTFSQLINKLLAEQHLNAQHRRKLEDCLKRLEFLYDKLRSQSLSGQVTSGLHEVVGCIQINDYRTALGHHNAIIQRSNFSEISAFMPALKSMLQIAAQLGARK